MKINTIHKVFLILLVSLVSSPLFAQIDTFVQKVTGAGTLTATVRAADGDYVTTSRIGGIRSTSFLVRKIKASGQKQWERMLNFQLDTDPFVSIDGIAQTTDGGFVLAGVTGCGCPVIECRFSLRASLVKLRANGTVAWRKSLGVSGFDSYRFVSVIPMPDGGVIAIGGLGFDLLLIVRVTATGGVVWKKSFEAPGGLSIGRFFCPLELLNLIRSSATPDNGFIVAFPTRNLDEPNGVDVMKITNLGNVVWKKSLRGDDFVFQSVGTTAGNGVILIGTGTDSKQLKVIVLTANGTFSWKAGYSLKVPGVFQSFSSPVQTPDGGYVLTGTNRAGNGFIAKIDASRKVVFQNTFGGSGKSIFATPDGGFFLFGATSTGSDILVSKVNSEGIVPGCSFFHSLGTTTRTPFGPLRIGPMTSTTLNDLSLEPFNFGLTSVVTNHAVSTVCQ